MRIAITGISGYTGTRLTPVLEGHPEVECILGIDVREPAFPLRGKCEFFRLDIRNPLVTQLLGTYRIDTVLHLAFSERPIHDSYRQHEINVIGAMKFFTACLKSGVKKVLLMSSTTVYGFHHFNPFYMREDWPAQKTRHFQYALDKIEVEKLGRRILGERKDLILSILRPCAISGPDANNYIIAHMAYRIVPTMMGYDPLIQFIHIDDLIDVCQDFLKKDYPGIYNVVADGVCALSYLIKAAGKIPLPIYHGAAYPLADLLWFMKIVKSTSASLEFIRHSNLASNEKLKEVAGFTPRYNSREAFEAYLEHERILKIKKSRERDTEISLTDALNQYNDYLEKSEIERVKRIIAQKLRVDDGN